MHMLRRQITIHLPAVIAAVLIIIGWSIANEYIHCVYNVINGYLGALGVNMNPHTVITFEAAVFIMAGVAIGAATCIIVMGIKKK